MTRAFVALGTVTKRLSTTETSMRALGLEVPAPAAP